MNIDKELIVITGNNGFLGKAITNALMDRYQVVGFDSDGEPQPPKKVECVCFDVTDEESVKRGLARMRYAYGDRVASFIHLAAYYDFSGEPSDLYDKVTVQGTQRILRHLQDFEVEQFIFSSSMLVHAPTEPGQPIDEDGPLEPKWDYPESKVRAERVIEEERGVIPAVLLRIAGVYTDQCDSIPLAQQMRRIYEDRLTSHVYPGDLSRGQSFVHLDDVVRSFTLAVERREDLPESVPLLIGEPETLGYGELQTAFGRLLRGDEEWQTEEIPKSIARSGAWLQDRIPGVEEPFIKPWMIDLADDHYELNIDRAKHLLGWTPARSLRKTLPKMAEALRNDPEGWYERHGFDPDDVPAEVEQPARVGSAH